MHRFFLSPALLAAPEVVFPAETAHQVRAVLRLRPGARVIALDDLGSAFELTLTQVDAAAVRAALIEKRPAQGEPRAQVTLFLGLTQREKFEWMLQKCTEIGAAGFAPFISSRALVQNEGDARKQERWRRILREAAEQSGRGRIPTLYPTLRFEAALEQARAGGRLALLAWEGEQTRGLAAALEAAGKPNQVALLIGPEGGFSEAEAALAAQHGVTPVSLGKRILRMETAAIAGCTLALHALGEMG